MWVRLAVALAAAVMVLWVGLIAVVAVLRPSELTIREVVRLLPDTARLFRRLATDRSVEITVRLRLWLLLAYLAMPLDIVPDFIPVIGHADDVIVVVATLRSVVRRSDPHALRRHWPGTDQGLQALLRLTSHPDA